ncbi:hypothetical protein F2Q69_00028873 [Brassica cretica]|uniref:Uncharacterized protein n=1 Tax=Brassica cretica TaxID=69181 RepID=A0A8S9RTA3_BRACR|nr:hypothetical protein F2Q69_00028873 [Brassica cretica]
MLDRNILPSIVEQGVIVIPLFSDLAMGILSAPDISTRISLCVGASSKIMVSLRPAFAHQLSKNTIERKKLARAMNQRPSDVPQSMDQSKESDQHEDQGVPIEVYSSARTRQTNRAVYRIDPADGHARINLGRANSDSDRGFSLLARLARTACTGDCADDLASLFDPIMYFSFLYLSKARILKLSEDLGHAGTQLVRSERPAAFAERPAALADRSAHLLIISALDTASSDESGQEPNGHLD